MLFVNHVDPDALVPQGGRALLATLAGLGAAGAAQNTRHYRDAASPAHQFLV